MSPHHTKKTLRNIIFSTNILLILFLLIEISLTTLAISSPLAGYDKNKVQPKRFIVKYKSSNNKFYQITSEAKSESSYNIKHSVKIKKYQNHTVGIFEFNSSAKENSINETIQMLLSHPDVEYVEQDQRRYPLISPSDPEFLSNSKYLTDSIIGINAIPAWSVSQGQDVIVAVIDTGIIREHPDIKDQIVGGYDFISMDYSHPQGPLFSANDGDGRDPDFSDPGDNVNAGECGEGVPRYSTKSSWHGTKVAGIISAERDDNEGTVGVAWDSKIISIRVAGRCGGLVSDINDAIRWAAGISVKGLPDNPFPAKIINLSLGAEEVCMMSEQEAIDDAITAGSLIVVSAGNSGVNALRFTPANCKGVFVVASIDSYGGLATFSNYGVKVDLSAPGVGITTATNVGLTSPVISGSDYDYSNGTSYSAALASGTAALALALQPSLNNHRIAALLHRSAHSFTKAISNNCDQAACGTGVVDAAHAMNDVDTATYNLYKYNGLLEAFNNSKILKNEDEIEDSLTTEYSINFYRIDIENEIMLDIGTLGILDTYGYLFDHTGRLLETNNDEVQTNGNNFHIIRKLSKGTYYIAVESFQRNDIGNYTIYALSQNSNEQTLPENTGGCTVQGIVIILFSCFIRLALILFRENSKRNGLTV